MIPPLRISFAVACPPEHAFAVWTSRIDTWWPNDHTVTGAPDLTVVLESGVGGRIYERTPEGVEYEWGVVTTWDPPSKLAYLWHIGQDREGATEVEVRFVPVGAADTRVEIEHSGWEQLGDAAGDRRDRNRLGWKTLLPHFVAATEKGDG